MGVGGGGGGGEMEMSQKEYVERLKTYHKELQRAWAAGERILSIKITIKCTRLLDDTSAPEFYPSLFVLVTEIMDTFGLLVYNRILGKAEEDEGTGKKTRLKRGWTTDDVNTNAKETCRNWFYKISSVRDLLPRLYLEILLLPCYRFLSSTGYAEVLSRIASMIRGISDPLIRCYLAAYLCRRGRIIDPTTTSYATAAALDYLQTFDDLLATDGTPKEKYNRLYPGLQVENFLWLQAPAVGYLFKTVTGFRAPKTVFTAALKLYRDHCGAGAILGHIVENFDPKHYCGSAAAMVALVKASWGDEAVAVFGKLAARFVDCPPPENQRMVVLNEVWRVVTKEKDIRTYVAAAASWMEVVVEHYSYLEVSVIMRDVVRHLNEDDAEVEGVGKELEPLVQLLVKHSYDYSGAILKSGELLQVLDKFKESRKGEHCKDLLEQFAKNSGETNDPVLINTLFEVSRTLHDSLDSLSPEGESRHVSSLINGFIDKVNYGRDFEMQLGSYVEFRSAFSNLDEVKVRLVECVGRLAMRTLEMMRGRHSKKTGAFVKGCLAFCHITIPSIDSCNVRLRLLVYCGWIGLKNSCLPQTDTFLKAAISLVPEADGKAAELTEWVGLFTGLLVMVPGSPEFGPFYLMQGLIKALGKWTSADEGGNAAAAAMVASARKNAKAKCLMSMLGCCSAWAQKKLPYTCPGVDSNDTLYGGGKDYMEELDELVGGIIGEIVEEIEGTSDVNLKDELILMLIENLTTFFNPDDVQAKVVRSLVKKVSGNSGKNKAWLERIKRRMESEKNKGISQ